MSDFLKVHTKRVVAMLLCLTFSWLVVGAQETSYDGEKPKREKTGLQIELTTNKTAYKPDEPILVTVTLRNRGPSSFLANSRPTIVQSASGGVITFEISDSNGEPVEGEGILGEFLGLYEIDLYEWTRRTRRTYFPGDFVGFTRSLEEEGFTLANPGRYRLRVLYWESDFKGWVEDKELEQVKKKLMFPLWSGEIASDPVWIEIQP